MTARIPLTMFAIAANLSPAIADLPTVDAAQLTEHSRTSSATVKLVPVTTQRQTSNGGVKCAVTTGKKANVTDPTVQPQADAGRAKIQSYAPDLTLSQTAQGGALGRQTLFTSAGNVVAGVDANTATLSAALSGLRIASQLVGTSQTVMAAFDTNSGTRLQNNLAWNSVGTAANLWVMALNALNLAATGKQSQLTQALRFTAPVAAGVWISASPPASVSIGQ